MIAAQIKVDVSHAQTKLARLLQNNEQIRPQVEATAQKLISILAAKTPVSKDPSGGQLRKGWRYEIKESGQKVSAVVRNTAPNAQSVLGFLKTGTDPHIISPRLKKVLAFYSSNQEKSVFAKSVHHPGTEPSDLLLSAQEPIQNEITDLKDRLKKALAG